jgi:hypothetical protein
MPHGVPVRCSLVTALVPLLLAACGGSPTSPSPTGPQLSERAATAHFEFAWSPGDPVNIEWQEAFHDWATRELQVTITRRISYSKYLSPTHMLALHYGPGNVNAWADPDLFTVHTIWLMDNHEVIHLYASTFGRATSLLRLWDDARDPRKRVARASGRALAADFFSGAGKLPARGRIGMNQQAVSNDSMGETCEHDLNRGPHPRARA